MDTWLDAALDSDTGLAHRDIAETNLLCAVGLPDAENVDIRACLNRLDFYAMKVGKYTERMLPQFRRKPWEYENSESYFRVLCMITALQRDLGVRYNPDKIDPESPLETADSFIHGVLFGNGGTCASMPVVYAAVGRRLGYPIKLASTRGKTANHAFARWDAPNGERFNIEATNKGLSCFPDDYYRTGIYEITPKIERLGGFLKSQSPREELACFLLDRGYCWLDHGNYRKATEAFMWASGINAQNRLMWNLLVKTVEDWRRTLLKRMPCRFPQLSLRWEALPKPKELPLSAFLDYLGLQATENMLDTPDLESQYWKPMREHLRLDEFPESAVARFDRTQCRIRVE